MEYQVMSDGACDLTMDLREQYNIQVVPFYVSFDENNYYKEIDEIGIREVYERMVSDPKTYPKTSLPSVQNYVDAFMPHVEAGRGVICFTITTSLSGSYNSAINAKEIIEEEYPDAKITVVNSMGATVMQEIHVIEAAKMKIAGYSYEEVVAAATGKMRDSGRIFFTVGDLDYLQHGGRIGKLAGMAGTMLKLKPMITLKDGEIESSGVARSRKKSMLKVIEIMKNHFENSGEDPKDYYYFLGFGYDEEEGREFQKLVDAQLTEMGVTETSSLMQIGATICVHTGPYALGIGLMKKYSACVAGKAKQKCTA
ncbi:MAG: DegV family protein [Lachnospiraceae bacterium]|nr:DegV family protein [Lachnospiraceae bacterium]